VLITLIFSRYHEDMVSKLVNISNFVVRKYVNLHCFPFHFNIINKNLKHVVKNRSRLCIWKLLKHRDITDPLPCFPKYNGNCIAYSKITTYIFSWSNPWIFTLNYKKKNFEFCQFYFFIRLESFFVSLTNFYCHQQGLSEVIAINKQYRKHNHRE